MDLVAHEGGDASGDFAYTLDLTDVSTGWTELAAVKNRAQVWVFEALQEVRQRLPFPLSGLDSDNGGGVEASQISFHPAPAEKQGFKTGSLVAECALEISKLSSPWKFGKSSRFST
jgi:hypothetical protein